MPGSPGSIVHAVGSSAGGEEVRQQLAALRFADPAAFSRAFKRWTGMSPRDMRKLP